MSAYQSEKSEMSSVTEASTLLRRVAGPPCPGDSVKGLIRKASRQLKWKFSRTRDVWYRHARRINAEEMDRLREAAARAEGEHALGQLVAMRESLAKADPDFHRPTIDALECAIRSMGGHVESVGFRAVGRVSEPAVNCSKGV